MSALETLFGTCHKVPFGMKTTLILEGSSLNTRLLMHQYIVRDVYIVES